MKTLESLNFRALVHAAVADGLEAAAVLDVDGKMLAVAGTVDSSELHAVAAVVANCNRSLDLLSRMLDGELVESSIDDRVIDVGIAARCVFVVVVPSRQPHVSRAASDSFRFRVERMISEARADFSGSGPAHGGSGGSSSGPATLPVVECGVTVPRKPS